MNAKLLCLPLLLSCLSLQAEIYKTVDAEGNVVFTDAPAASQDAEAVDIRTPNTIDAAPVKPHKPMNQVEPDTSYKSLTITPAHDTTIRSNNGNFSVSISVNPPLQPGHSVHLYFDGQRQSGSGTRYQFNNVDRGSHNLRATVVDGDGKVLIEQTNTVHVQRATAPRPAPLGQNDDDEISILPVFDDLISILPWVGDDENSVAIQPVWPKDRLITYEDSNGDDRTSLLQPTSAVWPKDRLNPE